MLEKVQAFLVGKKTYTGIIVAALGGFGITAYFGGEEATKEVVDAILVIVGSLLAIYGRFTASK